MTQVYFHCSNSREVRIDRSGQAVSELAEARDRAVGIVRCNATRKTGATGPYMSTTPTTRSSCFPSPSSSASRTKDCHDAPAPPCHRISLARATFRTALLAAPWGSRGVRGTLCSSFRRPKRNRMSRRTQAFWHGLL